MIPIEGELHARSNSSNLYGGRVTFRHPSSGNIQSDNSGARGLPAPCRGAGVYFLFGRAEAGGRKPKAYIGQAQNVIERIGNQVKEKDFWTEAILFVSKDKNINKGVLGSKAD